MARTGEKRLEGGEWRSVVREVGGGEARVVKVKTKKEGIAKRWVGTRRGWKERGWVSLVGGGYRCPSGLYTFDSPIDNLPEVGSIRIGPP